MTTDFVTQAGADELAKHIGHSIEMVGYGLGGKPPWHNLAIECADCGAVIADWTVGTRTGRYRPGEVILKAVKAFANFPRETKCRESKKKRPTKSGRSRSKNS